MFTKPSVSQALIDATRAIMEADKKLLLEPSKKMPSADKVPERVQAAISKKLDDKAAASGNSAEVRESDEKDSPFNWKGKASQLPKKPGEAAGFNSKKISTGTVFTKKYKKDKEEIKEALNDNLHPAGAALLKHIKPEHHNLYKPHLTSDVFNGSFKDRHDVLSAAKQAGHLNEEVEDLDEGLGHFVVKQLARLTNKGDLHGHHVNVVQKQLDSKLGTGHPQYNSILNKHKKMAGDTQYHKKSDDEARQHFADNMQTLHNDLKSASGVKEEVEELDEKTVQQLKSKSDTKKKEYGNQKLFRTGRKAFGEESEEVEQLDELSPKTLKSYAKKSEPQAISSLAAAHDKVHQHIDKTGKAPSSEKQVMKIAGKEIMHAAKRTKGLERVQNRLANEEVELDERTLTAGETSEKERIVKGMKKSLSGFKARYGDRAKNVMYATATKQAMKEEEELDEALKGKQTKLDKNHNGKLDAQDFKILRKEDIGGISTISEKKKGMKEVKEAEEAEYVRMEPNEDMKTKSVDTLAGRKKVGADYHNQTKSYKLKLNVESSPAKEGQIAAGGGTPADQGAMAAKYEKKKEVKPKQGMAEGKGTDVDPNFVTNESTPMKLAKEVAKKSFKKIRTETLGMAGATSEEKKKW
jgi:hypothetical protein